MAKASPIQPAYVSGEVSPLIRGRVDNERWGSSLALMENFIPLIQGPAQKRPGTEFIATTIDSSVSSKLIEFQFSTEQGYMLEFGDQVMRVYKDRALVLEGSAASITAATSANPVVVTAASHGFSNGDSVFIAGVDGMTSINNRIFTVANATTNTFELSGVNGSTYPSYSSGGSVAKVYEIATPYEDTDLDGLSWIQSADTLYIFHENHQPRTLTRTGHTSWAFDTFDMEDGPYLDPNTTSTTLTPADTGHATPLMTANNAPSPYVLTSSGGSTSIYNLFDRDLIGNQTIDGAGDGWVQVDLGSGNAKVVDAYSLTASKNNPKNDDMFSQWELSGSNDGSTYIVIDSRDNEVGWAGTETRRFYFENKTAFRYYKFTVSGGGGDDATNVDCAEIALHQAASDQTPFNLTASSTDGINGGDGFQSTDVGRQIRLLGSDGEWRWATIATVTSTTVVTVTINGVPLKDTSPIVTWRMGRYSNTTGWPTTGVFFENRLVIGGAGSEYYASQSGDYTNFAPTENDGTVTDANAVSVPNLLSREANTLVWLATDYRSLLLGTVGAEWVAKGADGGTAFSPTNIQNRAATFRGSYNARPVQVENATLFLSADQRYLHELAYVFEADGYKSPNITWLAEQVTASSGIKEMAHAKSPQSIIWAAREDGQLVAMTYEREQSVLAWHRHPMGSTLTVERVNTIKAGDGSVDVYLLIEKDGDRFICVMDSLWTSSDAIDDAFFVDAGVYYSGSAVSEIDGLWHLEGEEITGTADGEKFTKTVANGAITLDSPASKVSAGVGYTSRMETMPLNAGAVDGTAQGKTKRLHSMTFRILNSRGGKYAHDRNATAYAFPTTNQRDLVISNNLATGDVSINWPASYDNDGVVYVEHADPYPFTLVAHMPQVVTQDRN